MTPKANDTPTRPPTKTPLTPLSVDSAGPGQNAYVFETTGGVTIRYWLYLPENFVPNQKWPLILFLHGSEERGETIERVKAQPLPKLLDANTNFPFVVVSPQLPYGYWNDYIDPLEELLTYLEGISLVDGNRMYLTGLSLGGFGAWEYALRYPNRFAAVAPIAGGYIFQSEEVPEDICKLKNLPIWVFHGEKDNSVKFYQSQVLVDALEACNANVKFTLYPKADHQTSWLKAYADPDLYEWFLSYSK